MSYIASKDQGIFAGTDDNTTFVSGTDDNPVFGEYTRMGDDAKKEALKQAKNIALNPPALLPGLPGVPGLTAGGGPPMALIVAGGAAAGLIILAIAMKKKKAE